MFIFVCWLREGRGYVIRSVCLRVISYVSRITAKLTIETSNPATGFRPSLATVVSAEPFSHGTGTLQCLRKEMATVRHWSVSLWRDPDDVSHCRILSRDKTEWRLISATLCRWRRCFVADQLWLMTRIREEEDWNFVFWLGLTIGRTDYLLW